MLFTLEISRSALAACSSSLALLPVDFFVRAFPFTLYGDQSSEALHSPKLGNGWKALTIGEQY